MVLLTSAMNVFVKTFVFEINELRNKKKKKNVKIVNWFLRNSLGKIISYQFFSVFIRTARCFFYALVKSCWPVDTFFFFPSLSALISYITLGCGTLVCSFKPDSVSIIFGYQSVSSQDKLMVNNFSKWVEIYCSIHFHSFLNLAWVTGNQARDSLV